MYQIAKDSVARDTLGELSASELLILGRGFFMNADTPTEGAQPFPYSDILLRPVPNLHCNPKRPEYRQQWEHPVEQKKVKSQAAGLCSRR